MDVGRGGRNLKISAKEAVFFVSSNISQISPLLAPLEKLRKNPLVPPWKNLPTHMNTSM